MGGLPNRTADPRDSEFGRTPGPTSLIPNGHVTGAQVAAPDDELPFSKFVACFICGAQLALANQEGRSFWLTSCDHVLCGQHDHIKGRCTHCLKPDIIARVIDTGISSELKVFLTGGDQLFETLDRASDMVNRNARALRYQNDQLLRTVHSLQKQLNLSKEIASASQGVIDDCNNKEAVWAKEKAAMQSEIAELKQIVAINDRGLPSGIQHAMPSIAEEGVDGEVNGSAGKRQRTSLSPGLRLGPSVDRITLPLNAPGTSSSHGSHSSTRSGPRHMEHIRTAIGQYRYQPTPEPSTPMINGRLLSYRPQSAAPFAASPYQQPQGAFMPPQPAYPMPTPGPGPMPQNDVVARLRQNGRSERDDSPTRSASAMPMTTPQRPTTRSPLFDIPGSPYHNKPMQPPQTPGQAGGYTNGGFRPPLALTRPHTGSRF